LVQAKVIQTWQRLSPRERKEIASGRCSHALSLQGHPQSRSGKTPTMIAQGGLCAKSQVYRVTDRFIECDPMGLADRREDNGENMVTDAYGMELLRLIEDSPREHARVLR
jgi:hypothetical protein